MSSKHDYLTELHMIQFLEAQLEDNRRVISHLQETNEKLGAQINLLYRLTRETGAQEAP